MMRGEVGQVLQMGQVGQVGQLIRSSGASWSSGGKWRKWGRDSFMGPSSGLSEPPEQELRGPYYEGRSGPSGANGSHGAIGTSGAGDRGRLIPAKPRLSEFCSLGLSMFYETAPSKDIQGCIRSRRL